MLKRRLYLQICAIYFASLLAFALVAGLFWNFLGHDRFNQALMQKTTALAILLLPESQSPASDQAHAITRVAESLDIDITLFTVDQEFIASSAEAAEFPEVTPEIDQWMPLQDDSQWATLLVDGRIVIVQLNRIEVLDEATGIALALVLLALVVAIVMYPFIRQLTRRLERLQQGVEHIGSGYLGARVKIEGHDEVATLAQSFNSAAEKIEQLLLSQRLLLANASHELRTPLARIRLGIEMLRAEHQTSDRAQALEKDIRELDALIEELIMITRLDTDTELTAFESLDFVAMVAEECSRYEHCEFVGHTAKLHGDRRMLQRLVRNLIDNAQKHGKPPTRVSVEQSANAVILQVCDTGVGIPKEERERVFEPFYRAKDKQNVEGHGLGLPLVKKIAKAHNAAVNISSSHSSSITVSFAV